MTAPDSVAAEKAALRRLLRERRGSFAEAKACVPLLLPEGWADLLISSVNIAFYHAVKDEISPAPLIASARKAGARILFPRLDAAGVMDFADPGDDVMAPGADGVARRIPQPSPDAPAFAPDIIVCPLLGFDRCGGRLGQGGGHYDRAFAAYPNARRIGLAWSVQEVAAIPVEPHDVPLHSIITECEWIVP